MPIADLVATGLAAFCCVALVLVIGHELGWNAAVERWLDERWRTRGPS